MAKKDPRLVAFGRALRRHRLIAGLTQEKLASRAGLHITYVSGIERGERNVGLLTLIRIARALKLQASELVSAAERRARVRRSG